MMDFRYENNVAGLKTMDDKRKIQWQKVFWQNKHIFDSEPLAEITLSNMSDNRNINLNHWQGYYFFKVFFYLIWGLINIVPEKAKDKKAVFQVWLDRSNDWGLIWPLVKQFDQHMIPFYFELTEECYINHYDEILSLNNASILFHKKEYLKKICTIRLDDLRKAIRGYVTVRKIIKDYQMGSMWEFLSIYIVHMAYANGIYRKFYSDCLFSVSLGDRVFGTLYHLYGIKHYGIQHGDTSEEGMGGWTTLGRANVFAAFTYGQHYADLYHSFYGTNCIAAGHPAFSRSNFEFDEKRRRIVFFSVSHVIVDGNQVLRENDLDKLNTTLDEIIEFSHSLSNDYEFYIKLHPNENPKYLIGYNEEFGSKIKIISGDISSSDVLKSTLIAVSWGSTVNLEAIKMGCLSLQLTKGISYFPPRKFTLKIEHFMEVLDLLSDPKRMKQEFLRQKTNVDLYFKVSDNPEKEVVSTILYNANINRIGENKNVK